MRFDIMQEMTDILCSHNGEVTFKAVDDPYTSNYLVKGFRMKEGVVQYLSESKNKPVIALHNPYGHWYDIQKGYGYKTIRILAAYLEILRANV